MSHQLQSIASLWESFEKACLPPSAGQEQRHAMKMAFMSGAHTTFLICTHCIASLSDEDGEKELNALEDEFQAWTESMKSQSLGVIKLS